MAARIGIELSAVTCRIIELDAGAVWKRQRSETRVKSFASLPLGDPGTREGLAWLRGRHATVVVWTPGSDHRQVVVANGSYDRMRTEARAALRTAGLETQGMLCDIAPAAPHVAGMDRRTVLVASVPRLDAAAALRPLTDAGVKIDALLTPAAALTTIARMRQGLAAPDALEAYVALQEGSTSIAMVRAGVLLAAQDLRWGYLGDPPAHHVERGREEIAARLANDLSAFVAAGRFDGKPLAQVCVCGGLPELRSMTAPLMERLDVEVETLDALFGIDAAHLPEPADEFRERASELRLAWAAAVDRRPSLDLLRQRTRQARKAVLSRAAIVAGVAAGLGGGWMVQKRWRPEDRGPERLAQAVPQKENRSEPRSIAGRDAASGATNTPRASERSVTPPLVNASPAMTALPGSVAPTAPPRGAATSPGIEMSPAPVSNPVPRGVASPAAAPPVAAPPVAAPPVAAPPVAAPPARTETAPPRQASAPADVSAPATRPVLQPPAPAVAVPAVANRTAARPAVANKPPLPFDATLGTILYGPDRKLAIVDGRIVEAGDEVRGATIVEITPTAVMLRDAQGRLRRLTVGAVGR